MKKTLLLVVGVIVVTLIAGGIFVYLNNNKSQNSASSVVETTSQNNIENDTKIEPVEAQDSNIQKGAYVTLAEYNNNPDAFKDTKKVYFFHASWCSVCQAIDKEINADLSKIPNGVTIIKTDFDDSTDLRKKFGVTTQYTFVQVDSAGNEVSQWVATSFDSVLSGIKS
ncbi:MAG: hypothetical protein QG647_2 [Patescibacteria group bacterium]|nr:hypothetical protein [Patescibacteria group bacterium]